MLWLRQLRQLPLAQLGPDKLPDVLVERAVVELGGIRPQVERPQGWREALRQLAEPGGLMNGVDVTAFLCIPMPVKQALLDAGIETRKAYNIASREQKGTMARGAAKEARQGWNGAFDQAINGKHRHSPMPTLEANRELLEWARDHRGSTWQLKDHHHSWLVQWIEYVERRRDAGFENPVTNAFGRLTNGVALSSQAETLGFVTSQGRSSSRESAKTTLNDLGEWFARNPLRASAGARPFFSADACNLRDYVATTGAGATAQAALIGIMDAVAPQAMDGDYSPTEHAMHRNRVSQGFLDEVNGLLPQGRTLTDEEKDALTAMHIWFRRKFYGDVASGEGDPRAESQ